MTQPVHITRENGKLSGRDACWQAIRELKEFALIDIEAHTSDHAQLNEVNRRTARTYVIGLEGAGYLERTTKRMGGAIVWKLIRDVGVNAPRVNRKGDHVTGGESREQMWRTMRILKEFSWRDLVCTGSTEDVHIEPNTAKDYITFLSKANYLREVTPANHGGGLARYQLLPAMNTGPKPPMIQRIKQVFDPNLNKVVWPKDGE